MGLGILQIAAQFGFYVLDQRGLRLWRFGKVALNLTGVIQARFNVPRRSAARPIGFTGELLTGRPEWDWCSREWRQSGNNQGSERGNQCAKRGVHGRPPTNNGKRDLFLSLIPPAFPNRYGRAKTQLIAARFMQPVSR